MSGKERNQDTEKARYWRKTIREAARWRLAALPDYLKAAELATLLAAFDRMRPQHQRDYAIIRCLVDLGLRYRPSPSTFTKAGPSPGAGRFLYGIEPHSSCRWTLA